MIFFSVFHFDSNWFFLAAHNKPMLIRDLLKDLLQKLYNETRVRTELIREVEMGPFKHTVDGQYQ